ncbi:MAG TPA: ABC transporter ATP-binding protein [Syntrophomonas sp.]|nr:ABC transporter ATP-binding protein [Syntrophomonas sp.]
MLIETCNLSKQYEQNIACHEICLSIKEEQVFGLLGPNGAGKSTLVKMLLGLVYPTSGQARVLGFPAGHQKAKKQTGYLPELFRQYEWLSAAELLQLYARIYEIPASQQKKRIAETLQLVGLQGREKERIKGYSKGMQQRLALAGAILHEPALLFLDEPTSALDPIGRREVRDIISLLKAKGTTIFLNSHLLSEVEMTCTHLGFINHGKMIDSGPVEDFMQQKHEITIAAEEVPSSMLNRWRLEKRFIAQHDQTYTLAVDNKEEIPLLVEALVASGSRIYQVESRQRGLEDVFMELIQD